MPAKQTKTDWRREAQQAGIPKVLLIAFHHTSHDNTKETDKAKSLSEVMAMLERRRKTRGKTSLKGLFGGG